MAKTNWHLFESEQIGKLAQAKGDCLIEGKANGKKICVARYATQLYAFGAKCPHAGGPLGAGTLNDQGQVVCPWHRFGFDLKTGDCESGGYYIHTYPVEKRGAQLWIEMPRRTFLWW